MGWRLMTVAFLLFLSGGAAFGQEVAQTPETIAVQSASQDAPVVLPEPSPLAVQKYKTGIVLWIVSLLWNLAVPAFILFTGLSARLRTTAARWGRAWFFTIVLYWLFFAVLQFVLTLPLDFYAQYLRPHAYGLSNQTLTKWTQDTLIGLLITVIGGALVLWIPFGLLRLAPKRWWLYTGLLVYPFVTFVMLITPVWIDPLFNDFGPMKDKALEAKILATAEKAGIEGSRVYEVAKSVDTKTVNAYVTGFGQTKRIVLWDTLLQKLNEREVLFVMAHEMGHYVLGHVVRGILVISTLTVLGLFLVHLTANRVMARFKSHIGFDQLSDVAALPLLLLLMSIYSFLLTPLAIAHSRFNEHESDRFALELTRDNHAGASAFVKLFEENLAYPRPHWILQIWQGTHPTLADRVDFCNTYAPWKTGEALKYGHLFTE